LKELMEYRDDVLRERVTLTNRHSRIFVASVRRLSAERLRQNERHLARVDARIAELRETLAQRPRP